MDILSLSSIINHQTPIQNNQIFRNANKKKKEN